jgi:hypothetical protein
MPRLISQRTGGSGTAVADTSSPLTVLLLVRSAVEGLPAPDVIGPISEWELRLEKASDVSAKQTSMRNRNRPTHDNSFMTAPFCYVVHAP